MPQPPSDNAVSIRAFGEHLFSDGEFHRAIGEFERYIFLCAECGDVDDVRFRIAEAYKAGGDLENATRHFADLADRAHPGPIARNSRWEVASTLGSAKKDAEAARAFESYLILFPDDERAPLAVRGALRSWLRAELRDPALNVLRTHRDALSGDDAARIEARLLAVEKLPRRSSALAATLSAVLPGAGQAYSRDVRQGLNVFVMNALWISASVIAYQHEQYELSAVLGAGEVFWYGGGIVGAWRTAERYNRAQRRIHFQEALSTL